ncbi:Nuclear proteasome inhibitor UBLCP1 [Forsythia ovata]|uniref:Nuclear proteasome inhibitor UBLCP1 n=1 Tax=Forsythia ovata TaxID=205694 RepID=A0ABD1X842_9LAMI
MSSTSGRRIRIQFIPIFSVKLSSRWLVFELTRQHGRRAVAVATSQVTSPVTEEELTLTVKWSGKEYIVRVCGEDAMWELKWRTCEATNVLPKHQKLLYPKVGSKLSDDSLLLSQFALKASLKMTMIGTVDDEIIVDQVVAELSNKLGNQQPNLVLGNQVARQPSCLPRIWLLSNQNDCQGNQFGFLQLYLRFTP